MRRLFTFFYAAAILAFVATPVLAAPTTDYFHIIFQNDHFSGGTGDGYNDGTGMPDGLGNATPWYYYPNTGWYNQWFYDDPPDPYRYKEISYEFLFPLIPTYHDAEIKIALNWSTLAYPESGPDGPPPLPQLFNTPYEWLEEEFIHREILFEGTGYDVPLSLSGTYTIPDYNPEWVSIDIWVSGNIGPLLISGNITHECIPAPGAVLLGSIGVGLVGWLRRRRAI